MNCNASFKGVFHCACLREGARQAARVCLLAAPIVATAARGGELEIAREALRDGLWNVAREHAEKAGGEAARAIILESRAKEGAWDEIAGAVAAWQAEDAASSEKPASAEMLTYYGALALAEKGEKEKASAALAAASFETQEYRDLATRLRARLAADAGDSALALKLVRESGFESAGTEAKMAAASILASSGDRAAAEKIWREIAIPSNVTTRAYAIAAANLADVALLRAGAENAPDAKTRRFAGLRLGRILLDDKTTFDEGEKTIRAIIKDAPDSEGAMDAAIALADALLAREQWAEAADAFKSVLEIWLDAKNRFSVQEARGWALRKLGRSEEALEAFSRAEDVASGDDEKAMAILEQGDILAEYGKGDEAMAKYRLVLEKFPKSPAAEKLGKVVKRRELEAQGRELYNDYRFAEAQKIFAEIASEDQENAARAELMQALCMYAQGLDREAEEMAAKIAANASDLKVKAEATLWLAKLAYNSRRWEQSCSLFFTFAEMAPESERAPGALVWAARAAFAENDFPKAIRTVTELVEKYPAAPERAAAYTLQGEALVELGRYEEALLVIERALMENGVGAAERLKAEVLKADALFAMGADNPARYREALDAYRALRLGESLPPGLRLAISFKMGRVLEKLKRIDEAIDQYYTGVVLAYREARLRGIAFDDEARAAFSRAAFRLADEYESRGKDFQAMHILELVIASDVPAADEAEKRLDRIQTKGKFL